MSAQQSAALTSAGHVFETESKTKPQSNSLTVVCDRPESNCEIFASNIIIKLRQAEQKRPGRSVSWFK